ncbi:MAG: hypothetical protein WCV67_10560 [Victivallaceae bacterium]|jgi:hypothetical protein
MPLRLQSNIVRINAEIPSPGQIPKTGGGGDRLPPENLFMNYSD